MSTRRLSNPHHPNGWFFCPVILLLIALAGGAPRAWAAQTTTLKLWPGLPPLSLPADKPEAELPLEPGQHPDIVRLGNVSRPEITVYHPPVAKRNGTAILICPGGGYYILATKHEGTQVAEWLNQIGVTAAVLKYRVPAPKNQPAHLRPRLDGQRALSLLRQNAAIWGVDPRRIGVLGFSAGGHLAAWLIAEGSRRAEADPNPMDPVSCRPDFGILIYPAYLSTSTSERATPRLRPDEIPGPVFLVHAANDKLTPDNSIALFQDLLKIGGQAELHVYQLGGHGFGMLRQNQPVNDWPLRCEEWLRSNGWLAH